MYFVFWWEKKRHREKKKEKNWKKNEKNYEKKKKKKKRKSAELWKKKRKERLKLFGSYMHIDMDQNPPPAVRKGPKKLETEEEKRRNFLERNRQGD